MEILHEVVYILGLFLCWAILGDFRRLTVQRIGGVFYYGMI